MSVEEIRQVFEEELGPELREIQTILSRIQRRLEFSEEIERIRLDTAARRIESIQFFRALETRISALEVANSAPSRT
ncbi:MAG TPA: hypothetical protein VGE83_00430 [Terracidiphilus sp.]|jgi:hypothetical protein